MNSLFKIISITFFLLLTSNYTIAQRFKIGNKTIKIGKKPIIKAEGNKTVVTEKRVISYYSAIKTTGPFNIRLIKGKGDTLSIKAESNLLPFITTKVVGGILNVK